MTQLHTSRWVYGFDHNVLFNSGRVVCGMHKHNNPAETAVVVYGLDQQRGQGEGKGAEETKIPNAYDREYSRGWGLENVRVLCVRVRCCQGKWWAKPHTLLVSPTHPYGRKELEATTQTTKTGR